MGIEVTGGGQRVLFEERSGIDAISQDFVAAMSLPLCAEHGGRAERECGLVTCELKRSTLFTSRVVTPFTGERWWGSRAETTIVGRCMCSR